MRSDRKVVREAWNLDVERGVLTSSSSGSGLGSKIRFGEGI